MYLPKTLPHDVLMKLPDAEYRVIFSVFALCSRVSSSGFCSFETFSNRRKSAHPTVREYLPDSRPPLTALDDPSPSRGEEHQGTASQAVTLPFDTVPPLHPVFSPEGLITLYRGKGSSRCSTLPAQLTRRSQQKMPLSVGPMRSPSLIRNPPGRGHVF